MIPKLESAEYAGDYRIRVRFADGRHGEVDLVDELWGEVFEPLRDHPLFRDGMRGLLDSVADDKVTAQHAASAAGRSGPR